MFSFQRNPLVLVAIQLLFLVVPTLAQTACNLIVPNNPLTVEGLSTPYLLEPPCDQTNIDQSVFVEAVILDTHSGDLYIYAPLVINSGTKPLIPPIVPKLPSNAVVGIWFGSNCGLRLVDSGSGSLTSGACIDGAFPGDIFGQVGACNAISFFSAVTKTISSGLTVVPGLKLGLNGKRCYTIRGFQIVDQDQSDNVDTEYLSIGNRTAQSSAANKILLGIHNENVIAISNPSDNGLLDKFVAPALHCTPFQAPDLTNNSFLRSSQALNEIQAQYHQLAPVAYIPAGDPMALVNGSYNLKKVNAYRSIVNQPPAQSLSQASTTEYCWNLVTIGLPAIYGDQKFTINFTSPEPAEADSLFTFLIMRFMGSFTLLNCEKLLEMPCPVHTPASWDPSSVLTVNQLIVNESFILEYTNNTVEYPDPGTDSSAGSVVCSFSAFVVVCVLAFVQMFFSPL